jgi:hypothetical protein
MKKIVIIVCLLAFLLSACTLAPSQDKTVSKTATSADSSAKAKAQDTPVKAKALTALNRPSKVTDKDVSDTQKIFNDLLSGKIKSVDANKKLDKIANKVGNVGLVWIVRNLP